MNEFLMNSAYFGFFLSILAFWIGTKIQKKFPYTICSPLLISILLCIFVLKVCRIDYDTYNNGAKYISYLLTPTTVCLAIPLYKQIRVLKDNLGTILISILCGCIAAAIVIFALCKVLGMDAVMYHSLQPKSITTAIAIGVSEEIGGNATLTTIAVIITGIFGSVIAKTVCSICRVTHPVAVGLACGNAAHAIGTSKAMEFGELQGAMSSLSVVVAGLITVVLAPICAGFWH